jgi:hypothetical protein
MTISNGPAIRASFDAPILLMESYHVSIPNESDKDARIRIFNDLIKRFFISSFFLKIKFAIKSNIIPAEVILIAESIKGENLRNEVVKYSTIIDSAAIVVA